MALRENETRKITTYGIYGLVMGSPIGIGYWHSERGPGDKIQSEQSARPGL
jgi:hypothetical protein